MADGNETLPAPASRMGLSVPDDIPTDGLPLTLRIMLDERMYEKVKQAAGLMSRSEGFVGKHLIGKPEACFAVITRSMEWRLDPFFVGQATYQTPGGSVGFEGKLCQAILENSGRVIGGVKFEHYGDWSKLVGKFEIAKGSTGRDYAKPTWTKKDAEGLGVTVVAQVRGEAEPRRWSIDLVQAWPLNSPLWATDPRSQICYLAVRRFGDLAAPGIYGGVRFNVDEYLDASEAARDVTPQLQMADTPTRETRSVVDVERNAEPDDDELWEAYDAEGEALGFRTPAAFAEAVMLIFADAAKRHRDALETAYDNNSPAITQLRAARLPDLADQLESRYRELRATLPQAPPAKAAAVPVQPPRRRTRNAPAPEQQQDSLLETADPTSAASPSTSSTPPQGEIPGNDGPDDEAATSDEEPPQTVAEEPQQPVQQTAVEIPPFWRGNLMVDLPRRPQGGHNWPAFADQVAALVATAPAATSIAAFRTANQRALADLKTYYAGGFAEFEQAVAARSEVLGSGQ